MRLATFANKSSYTLLRYHHLEGPGRQNTNCRQRGGFLETPATNNVFVSLCICFKARNGSMGRTVQYIYLHCLVDVYGINVDKYTSPMDAIWAIYYK